MNIGIHIAKKTVEVKNTFRNAIKILQGMAVTQNVLGRFVINPFANRVHEYM